MPIPISGPTTITEPGEYELVNDISGVTYIEGDGVIDILANDVTLNGNGYKVVCSSSTIMGTAIYVGPYSNIRIYNVTCRGFIRGIHVHGGSYVNINNVNCINNYYGFLLTGSDNNTINNITTNNGTYGMYVSNSNNNTMVNVTANNNLAGIYLRNLSNNNTILDSIVSNSAYGIFFDASNYNNVINITADKSGKGMLLISSNNNSIENSTLSDNDVGIYLGHSNNNNITTVSFNNCGIYVRESYNNTVTDTIVNGKPLVYLENVDGNGMVINNAGQVILVNCRNITVRDVDLSNTTVGIQLWSSELININNIIANNNNWYGIDASFSFNNSIANSILNNNGWGGIYLWESRYNNITNSTMSNSYYGICLDTSNYNNITNVRAEYNEEGIWFFESYYNLIYNNYFNNIVNVSNYEDETWANRWNIEKSPGKNIVGGPYIGGNYWGSPDGTGFSDLAVDSDGDGIADEPYIIDSQNIDYYPLVKVPEEPEITLPPPPLRLAPPPLPPLPREERVIVEKQTEIRKIPVIPEELFVYGALSAGMIPLILVLLKRK